MFSRFLYNNEKQNKTSNYFYYRKYNLLLKSIYINETLLL